MKYSKIVLTFFLIGILHQAMAQVDSSTVSKIVSDGQIRLVSTIKGQTKEITDSIKAMAMPVRSAAQILPQSTFWSSLLCFAPALLFLAFLASIAVKMRRENMTLSDILIDKELQVAIQKEDTKVKVATAEAKEALVKAAGQNPDAVRAIMTNLNLVNDVPTAETKEPSQSTSRFIAFLTGITSLIIAVCITTFFFYRWSIGDHDIDFSRLSTVLYGLGLGILPYGFSKIASVLK